MKLFLLEDHELPLVDGIAMIRTGNLFDPPDKIGLATLTGIVLRLGGTISKTGDDLNDRLETMAASVESEIGESSGSVRFSALKANTDEVLDIFRDVLTAPALRQDKIDFAKGQLHSVISRRNDNAAAIAQREFVNTVYGKDSPYGWTVEHTHIDRIHRSDMQAFYRRYFFPANVIVGIAGDFDAAEMRAKIEKLFAGWTVKQETVPEFPKVAPEPARGVYIAVKNDVTQTFFSMGQRGSEYRDKALPALALMTDILGTGFQSRLFQRIRSRMGVAYNIGAVWNTGYDHPGVFEISGSTKSLSTLEALKAVEEEVERMRTSEVSEQELKTAKEAAMNRLAFAFDTKMKTLNRVLLYAYYGYPADFLQQLQAGLAAVTRADILRAAKEHLDPSKFTIVAVGSPQDFGHPLDELGTPKTIDLTIPPSSTAATPTDSASIDKGKQLLGRAQQALGGADKLAGVKDWMQVTQHVVPAINNAQMKHTDRWIGAGIYRADEERLGVKLAAYWDGKAGWFVSPQGYMALGGVQLREMQAELFRQFVPLMLSDRVEGRTVSALDEDTIEVSDKNGNLLQIVMDGSTGLPAKLLYRSLEATGTPIAVEEDWSDFRDVAGVKVPYRVVSFHNGQKFSEGTVVDIKVNSGLKQVDLAKRP